MPYWWLTGRFYVRADVVEITFKPATTKDTIKEQERQVYNSS